MSDPVLRVALAGNPNCGKTALFNAITGGRQKVGNYPGVTVERKEGTATTESGRTFNLLDLPGAYSLDARTPDEEITRNIILGKQAGEQAPELLVAVADATNLERSLGLVLEVRDLGKPVVLALNMMDLAEGRSLDLDLGVLARELKVPIVPTVAVKRQGISELLRELEDQFQIKTQVISSTEWRKPSAEMIHARFAEIDRILKVATRTVVTPAVWTDRIDRVVLHPLWGSLLLFGLFVVVFQAVFTWAATPQDWIDGGIAWLAETVKRSMADGPLRSLLVDGVIAGVGGVVIFLPQILILFAFILALEDSGYMARAAFLMDRLMGKVGLHGRAFIPLLSSYACAIPGIMATRTIENPRDRLTTILVAPMTTCSARLPVYALLIAAFIPATPLVGPLTWQGATMAGLYFLGIALTLAMAFIFRKTLLKGPKPPLLLELPTYKWPDPRNLVMGLWERARIFIRRAGTVILTLSILIWFLASYPKAPEGSAEPAIHHSYAGQLGRAIEPALRPLGFDWRISIALIPGFAAREVMVSTLGTVYAVEGDEDAVTSSLTERLARDWTLPTALSLLVWYVIALQCLSTVAIAKRETNSWKWPLFMLGYLTALAYSASFVTYNVARWLL